MPNRILIVDDEHEIRKALTLRLKHAGYAVAPATKGNEAIEAYSRSLEAEDPFDLIILDIMMPEVDGVQVLETIRREEQERGVHPDQRVRIIMLTALKQPWMESQAVNKGCDDYLIKPYSPFDLLRKIEEQLQVACPI